MYIYFTHLTAKIVLVLFLALAVGCNNEKKQYDTKVYETIKQALGTELKLQDSLNIYNPFPEQEICEDSPFLIYTLVDASCGTCISEINEWKAFNCISRMKGDCRVQFCEKLRAKLTLPIRPLTVLF